MQLATVIHLRLNWHVETSQHRIHLSPFHYSARQRAYPAQENATAQGACLLRLDSSLHFDYGKYYF